MMKKEDYFALYEQIKGERAMIIMDLKADNLYGFHKFHLNMSYPKKIVGSPIDGEYLEDRPNFRYKKVNIILGGNATGKTTLGKLLNRFVNYCDDGQSAAFTDVISDRSREASFDVDFVSNRTALYRFQVRISPPKDERYEDENVYVKTAWVSIGKADNYENCARKLDDAAGEEIPIGSVPMGGWSFSYPEDVYGTSTSYLTIEEDENYLPILEKILKTLDPSIRQVVKLGQIKNTYAIILGERSVIIKDGKLLNADILSSGTRAGLEISYVIASLFCNRHTLYYCDELFSYVHSEVEKACLSIIIEKLQGRKQLFFTSHNMELLHMQLPKHSFHFLKKDRQPGGEIHCVNAADFLKRNTDSLPNAVENDMFSVSPDLEELYSILDLS